MAAIVFVVHTLKGSMHYVTEQTTLELSLLFNGTLPVQQSNPTRSRGL